MSVKKPTLNGKPGSRPSATLSNHSKREARLRQLLAAVYSRFQELADPALDAQCKQDFIFHMLDWNDNLHRLSELYEQPERFTPKSAAPIIAGFLLHAIWHLRAAGRLLLDNQPEDIFVDLESKVRKRGSGSSRTKNGKNEAGK